MHCEVCGEPIGTYEPLLVCPPGGAVSLTSRLRLTEGAEDPPPGTTYFHQRCGETADVDA